MKKIILRLYKDNKKIRQYRTATITTKIYNLIGHKLFDKAYLRVNYGKKLDTFGNKVMFYNDAWITDKKELIQMIKIFWSES